MQKHSWMHFFQVYTYQPMQYLQDILPFQVAYIDHKVSSSFQLGFEQILVLSLLTFKEMVLFLINLSSFCQLMMYLPPQKVLYHASLNRLARNTIQIHSLLLDRYLLLQFFE